MSSILSHVLMIGTSLRTKGGIASVVQAYINAGLMRNGEVRYIETHIDVSAIQKTLFFSRALVNVIRAFAFDHPALLHLHLSMRASFWRKSVFMGLALLFRVPYLIHLHGSEFQVFFEQESSAFGRWIIRAFFARSAAVIVLSGQWREWVQTNCPANRIKVIYNPVQIIWPHERDFHETNNATVLFLGRLGQRKGAYDLVEAFSRIAHEFPRASLILAGDGEIDAVKARIDKLGLRERISCPGWVTGELKDRLLYSATVFVLPSYNEGLPMSILEAMAHGVPIITTPVGGIPDAISDGLTGLIVAPGDVESLSLAIKCLLSDAPLRARLGNASIALVRQRFAVTAIVERLRAVHAELKGASP